MSANDSRVHFKLDEITESLRNLGIDIFQGTVALDEADGLIAEAREKVLAATKRRQEIATDVAILREMLGVR